VSTLAERLQLTRARIERAAAKCGKSGREITLVGVTKTIPLEAIAEARALGLVDFGENKVQEARQKVLQAAFQANWHLIGHLQTNKVKQALSAFSLIHSLDRADLALEIQKQCDRAGITCHTLLQVNIAGEETKFGVGPDDTLPLLLSLKACDRIYVDGLMTIAPYSSDPETVRPVFRKLREMAARLAGEGQDRVRMQHLSMGMSGDFEVAIEEGATMVRIGTAVFGPRQATPVV